MNNFHISVLLQETIANLHIKMDAKYIDATIGGGGHAMAICEKGGIVLGIDQDTQALSYVHETDVNKKVTLVHGNFSHIKELAQRKGFGRVSGIIFDLGVSSFQLDERQRGFSFTKDAPLDMRMDRNQAVTACDLVNGLHKGELIELFTKLGEEPYAKNIAQAIVMAREWKKIETTGELASLIEKTVRSHEKGIHPATRVFQALRIAVNDELHSLREALPQAMELLHPSGRLLVISFHSLEDRIVKNAFLSFESEKIGRIITPKPITASEEEIRRNHRSRSAKMRIIEKI